jgi:hypothetical protein
MINQTGIIFTQKDVLMTMFLIPFGVRIEWVFSMQSFPRLILDESLSRLLLKVEPVRLCLPLEFAKVAAAFLQFNVASFLA